MLIGNRPGRKRKVPQGTGTRIIGQVAGHEINLEIEDVLKKIHLSYIPYKSMEFSYMDSVAAFGHRDLGQKPRWFAVSNSNKN